MFKPFAYYLGVKASRHAHLTVESRAIAVDFPLYSYAYIFILHGIASLLNEERTFEEGACDFWYAIDGWEAQT